MSVGHAKRDVNIYQINQSVEYNELPAKAAVSRSRVVPDCSAICFTYL